MKNIRLYISSVIVALMIVMSTSHSFAQTNEELEVIGIENIEMNGFTGIKLSFKVKNNSKKDISMENCLVTLNANNNELITLFQSEKAVAPACSTEIVKTVWSFENVDAGNLMMFGMRVAQNDLSGITASYTAELSNGRNTKTYAAMGVDISKYTSMLIESAKSNFGGTKAEPVAEPTDKKRRKK